MSILVLANIMHIDTLFFVFVFVLCLFVCVVCLSVCLFVCLFVGLNPVLFNRSRMRNVNIASSRICKDVSTEFSIRWVFLIANSASMSSTCTQNATLEPGALYMAR